MNINTKNFPMYAGPVLRIGSAIVVLWFGFQQFLHTSSWVGFVPEFIVNHSPVDVETLVHFNGAVEIVFGTALIIGIFSRVSAAILALHMAHITLIVGYDATGVRDFGLVVGTTAAALLGPDIWSLESYLSFRKDNSEEEVIVSMPEKPKSQTLEFNPVITSNHTLDSMVEYIKKEKLKGTPVNIVYNSLSLKGWTIADIEKAYQEVNHGDAK